jgi:predicted XRE-type DNA-binding protein
VLKVTDAIKKMLKDNHKTQGDLSTAMGINRNSVSMMLSRDNINTNSLISATEYLGYDIILKPRNEDNKSEETIKITKE